MTNSSPKHAMSHLESPTPRDMAPGLFRDFERVFSPEEVQLLCACLQTSAASGGLREEPIQRAAGVSFNPRPARLSAIALKELKENNLAFHMACLLFYVPTEKLSRLAEASAPWLSLAQDIVFRDKPLQSLPSTQENRRQIEQLVLIHFLDLLRHLHMTNLDESDKRKVIRRVGDTIAPEILSDGLDRLTQMIDHLLPRVRQKCNLE